MFVTHKHDLVYPVVVEAECFIPDFTMTMPIAADVFKPTRINKLPENQRRAATDEEFIKLVGEVLRSPQVRSLIQSLIARSNDQRIATETPSSANGEDPE